MSKACDSDVCVSTYFAANWMEGTIDVRELK